MLTKKQKKYLAGLAVSMDPIFQIGKEALSDNFIDMVDKALEKRELIKIKVLKTAPEDLQELAFDLAMNTESEVVQRIGRTLVLYRRSHTSHVIELPHV
jgi:RNA-binding protein